MKRIIYLTMALAFTLALLGCGDNGGDDDKQIELPDKSEQTQKAFADEQTTGGFTFTAKAAWTATVTGATRASSVPWLRLMLGGKETYEGAAGTHTLTIELDANYTGATRSATITIISGGDRITISVTQEGKTEQGQTPVDPVNKKIVKITIDDSDGEPSQIALLSYDDKDRLTRRYLTNYDGEGSEETVVYTYAANSLTIAADYVNSNGSGKATEECTLGADGYATALLARYLETGEDEYEEARTSITYTDGRLAEVVHTYTVLLGNTEGLPPVQSLARDITTAVWDAAGNMTRTVMKADVDDNGAAGNVYTTTMTYSEHENRYSLDMHQAMGENYIPGISGSYAMDIFGKRTTHLLSRVEVKSGNSYDDELYTYTYTFDKDGLLTKAVVTDEDDKSTTTYQFFYE